MFAFAAILELRRRGNYEQRLDLPSRVLVVRRRKTERGTDTEDEAGIILRLVAEVAPSLSRCRVTHAPIPPLVAV